MSASLEDRRRAVAEALRRVARESQPSDVARIERRLDEVTSRLNAVETALLEAAWERPAVVPGANVAEEEVDERVPVPAVPLGEGRMSSVASRALFGH